MTQTLNLPLPELLRLAHEAKEHARPGDHSEACRCFVAMLAGRVGFDLGEAALVAFADNVGMPHLYETTIGVEA